MVFYPILSILDKKIVFHVPLISSRLHGFFTRNNQVYAAPTTAWASRKWEWADKVLFPQKHGKIPVEKKTYLAIKRQWPLDAESFLIETDGSELPLKLSGVVDADHFYRVSLMDTSISITYILRRLFYFFQKCSSHVFPYELLFNCSEKKTHSNISDTIRGARPDTLVIASGCTLIIGEHKVSSLHAAENDLLKKTLPLSTRFYGKVQFILGYIAAGTVFQWVYIGKNGKQLKQIAPPLDLSVVSDRCRFVLSIGYAYQLLKIMVDSLPDVPGHYAMLSTDVARDRELCFLADSVCKRIKNFEKYCKARGTDFAAIKKAYKVAEGCQFLPKVMEGPRLSLSGTHSPLGHSPILRSQQHARMLAQHVYQASYTGISGTQMLCRFQIIISYLLTWSQWQFLLSENQKDLLTFLAGARTHWRAVFIHQCQTCIVLAESWRRTSQVQTSGRDFVK